jgi:hypothetical protein
MQLLEFGVIVCELYVFNAVTTTMPPERCKVAADSLSAAAGLLFLASHLPSMF